MPNNTLMNRINRPEIDPEEELGKKIPYEEQTQATAETDLTTAKKSLVSAAAKIAAALLLLSGQSCVSVESFSVGYNANKKATELRVTARPRTSGKQVIEDQK